MISELIIMKSNYIFLADLITKLESSKLSLSETLALVKEVETKLSATPDAKIKEKLPLYLIRISD